MMCLYADPHHEGQPICTPCAFEEHLRSVPGAEEIATRMEAIGVPFDMGALLDKKGWQQTAGACWRCVARSSDLKQLIISFCTLRAELHGADEWRKRCAHLAEAARAANDLRLQIEKRPGYVQRPEVCAGAQRLGAELRAALAQTQTPMGAVLVDQVAPRLKAALALPASGPLAFNPMELGAAKLGELALVLAWGADLEFYARCNFAGVVREAAKDPANLPVRLALVVAYQWAQELRPPLGRRALAQALIEHGAIAPSEEDDSGNTPVDRLADNIKDALRTFKHMGKVDIWTPRGAPPLEKS